MAALADLLPKSGEKTERLSGDLMTTHKKEHERVREAMSKSLAANPSRQAEIAEMLKRRLSAEDQKPEQSNGKKRGKK